MSKKNLVILIIINIIIISILMYLIILINKQNNIGIINNNLNESINSNINDMADNIINEISIEKYEYNQYIPQFVSDETMCKIYLNNFVTNALNKPEIAFSILNTEYREKKFKDINAFNTFIKNTFLDATNQLTQYKKVVYEDYTQYICKDEKNRYYIFNETSPMQYTVILDTYTIDLPEFIEQYNSLAEDKKVQFNIQKFFDAINDGDYTYAYNRLDETYKNNNFPTQVDFENYMKTNFYSQNKISYTSYEKNGDLYIYRMVITNGEDSSQTIEKQFVVKLLEGTDFVMSFEK